MTAIDSGWKRNLSTQQERQFPEDEYHPYSVDWEVVRAQGGPWKIDSKDPRFFLNRISGRRVSRELAQFQDERNPQTGCG